MWSAFIFKLCVLFYFILSACIVMEEVYNKIIYQQSSHDIKLITTLKSFNRKMVLTLRTSGMTLSSFKCERNESNIFWHLFERFSLG